MIEKKKKEWLNREIFQILLRKMCKYKYVYNFYKQQQQNGKQ